MSEPFRILLVEENAEHQVTATRELAWEYFDLQVKSGTDVRSFAHALESGGFNAVINRFPEGWNETLEAARLIKREDPERLILLFALNHLADLADWEVRARLKQYLAQHSASTLPAPDPEPSPATAAQPIQEEAVGSNQGNAAAEMPAAPALEGSATEFRLTQLTQEASELRTLLEIRTFELESVRKDLEGNLSQLQNLEAELQSRTASLEQEILAYQSDLETRERMAVECEDAKRILEHELRLTQLRLASFFKAVPDAALIVSESGLVLDCNPGALRTFGVAQAHHIVGEDISRLLEIEFATLLNRSEEAGWIRGPSHRPVRFRNGQADRNWGELFLAELPGTPPQFLCLVRDMRRQLRLETALQHQRRLEGVGKTVLKLADKFTNQLTTALGFAAGLREHLTEGNQLRDLEIVIRSTEEAHTLAARLAVLSRTQTEGPSELDLNSLLYQSAATLKELFGLDFQIDLQPDPALDTACVDFGKLYSLVVNLMLAAGSAGYTNGQVTIRTQAVPGRLASTQTESPKDANSAVLLAFGFGHGIYGSDSEERHDLESALALSSLQNAIDELEGTVRSREDPQLGHVIEVFIPLHGVM